MELHGDRAGYDDPAIVTGIGTIDGKRYMFMGHQKGRNTKENIMRNFGMPTPHGYVLYNWINASYSLLEGIIIFFISLALTTFFFFFFLFNIQTAIEKLYA